MCLGNDWRSLTEASFLGAYLNGVPCNPDRRDSDLSLQPMDGGLALCYRDLFQKKIYFVLKDVRSVTVSDAGMEIAGTGP